MHGGDREQRRDRDALRPDGAVGEDEDVRAVAERVVGLGADPVDRLLEPVDAGVDRPRRVDRVRLEDLRVDLAQRLELVVAQDRVVDDQLPCVLGRLGEQVALGADERLHAHHDGLADRVDRRVRDLCEELLEVRVEERPAVREHRERRVVPHRAHRLLRIRGERREHHLHVLLRVAERELQAAQRLALGALRLARRQVGEAHVLALEPLGVRAARRDLVLHLLVGDDAPLLEVDEEQLPRLQAALAHDVLRRDVEHARLGGEHDPAVAGLEPAAGTQPVAVERRADHPAVGERDRRRAVPCLGQALVEGVEAAQVVGHVGAARVRLGHHHHQRVRQRAAGQHEQLEHVVEHRSVGAAGPDDRQHLVQVVAEQLRCELRLARTHPVDVPAQRVDLAVVRDHAIRVRELPARERVRREAGVHERQRAREARVAEVRVVAPELRRGQHPLVDERARGEARHDEVGAGGELGDAPDHVQLALERVGIVRELGRRADEELAHDRREETRMRADVPPVDRHVAPSEQCLALRLDRLLQQLLELEAARGALRQEAHADAVGAARRQVQPCDRAQERVRRLHEDPRAVAGVRVGTCRAPVLEVLERGQRARHGLVRRLRVEPGDERHTARIVLERRVVQALLLHAQ